MAFIDTRAGRVLLARRRLLASIVAGALLFAVLPDHLRLVTRILMAWDLTALIYVVFAFVSSGGVTPSRPTRESSSRSAFSHGSAPLSGETKPAWLGVTSARPAGVWIKLPPSLTLS